MTTFTGTSLNDPQDGTTGDDIFNYGQGGNDTLNGLEGNDTFNMAGTLTAADSIKGGAGNDTVNLNGNYSTGVIFGVATMVNVETLVLSAGNSYNLTLNAATVMAGQ